MRKTGVGEWTGMCKVCSESGQGSSEEDVRKWEKQHREKTGHEEFWPPSHLEEYGPPGR